MARRVRGGKQAHGGGPGPHQELPRLRDVPGEPDRRHGGAERPVPGGGGGGGGLPEAKGLSGGRFRQERLGIPEAAGNDVRLGPDPRAFPDDGLGRVLQAAADQREGGRLPGRRFRRARGGVRAVRPGGERAPDTAGETALRGGATGARGDGSYTLWAVPQRV